MVGTSESHKISKSLDCLSIEKKERKKERFINFFGLAPIDGGANASTFFFLKRETLEIIWLANDRPLCIHTFTPPTHFMLFDSLFFCKSGTIAHGHAPPPPCANTPVWGNASGVVGRGRSNKSSGESSSLWRWLWQMLLLLQVCKLATLFRLLWHLSRTVPQSRPRPSYAFTWWFLFSFYLGAPRTTMWFWRSRERFSMEELR